MRMRAGAGRGAILGACALLGGQSATVVEDVSAGVVHVTVSGLDARLHDVLGRLIADYVRLPVQMHALAGSR